MERVYFEKQDCCGCTACYSICPTGSISMVADEEGFLYPVIDENTCIDCDYCIDICPMIVDGNYKETSKPTFLVAKHKSDDVLMHSTSGGAFTALSDAILRQNGVIYGVDYDGDFNVHHTRTENVKGRDRMRISKYVQSDLGDTFKSVESDLKQNRTVIFTGTPCQTAGLKAYIGNSKLRDKLYICDLICHSIPSPRIWNDYKALLEEETDGKLIDIQFRSKIIPWTRENSNKTFLYKTNVSEDVHNDDRFYKLFFGKRTITRPSCAKCPFTDYHRASDITIADYWGIEKYSPEWMDEKGVSVIILNNERGKELLQLASYDLSYEERPMSESLNEQQRLSEPVEFPKDRDAFWQEYDEHGFKYIIEKL